MQKKQVKYFFCGMSNGFVSISKKSFSNVRICIDSFHVAERLSDMVDDVRLRYQHQFQDAFGVAPDLLEAYDAL